MKPRPIFPHAPAAPLYSAALAKGLDAVLAHDPEAIRAADRRLGHALTLLIADAKKRRTA